MIGRSITGMRVVRKGNVIIGRRRSDLRNVQGGSRRGFEAQIPGMRMVGSRIVRMAVRRQRIIGMPVRAQGVVGMSVIRRRIVTVAVVTCRVIAVPVPHEGNAECPGSPDRRCDQVRGVRGAIRERTRVRVPCRGEARVHPILRRHPIVGMVARRIVGVPVSHRSRTVLRRCSDGGKDDSRCVRRFEVQQPRMGVIRGGEGVVRPVLRSESLRADPFLRCHPIMRMGGERVV